VGSVQYVVSLLLASVCYCAITQLMFLILILCLFCVLYFCFLFYVFSVFCIVLCIVSPFVYICLFPIFLQVYRPPPPGGNRIAVNKYHIYIFDFKLSPCSVCCMFSSG
jgi:hypothetical protein